MSGNPSDIGHTGESVIRVSVKDVLEGKGGAEEVTTGAVDDTLGLTGGTRGLRSVSPKTALEARKQFT